MLQVSIVAIIAIGSTVVILSGGIDLSPGSADRADDGRFASAVKFWGVPFWLAVLLALLIGLVLGFDQRRAHRLSADSLLHHHACRAVRFSRHRLHVQQRLAGLPGLAVAGADVLRHAGRLAAAPVLCRVLYALAYWFLRYTALGRSIYAVGGNASAARLSGINVARVSALRLRHRRVLRRAGRCADGGHD